MKNKTILVSDRAGFIGYNLIKPANMILESEKFLQKYLLKEVLR